PKKRAVTPSSQDILDELQKRVKDPRGATDDAQNPGKVFRRATSRLIKSSDKKLGFRLPQLLRLLYTEVGNGGFGPFYGFLGLEGGATLGEGKTVAAQYKELR